MEQKAEVTMRMRRSSPRRQGWTTIPHLSVRSVTLVAARQRKSLLRWSVAIAIGHIVIIIIVTRWRNSAQLYVPPTASLPIRARKAPRLGVALARNTQGDWGYVPDVTTVRRKHQHRRGNSNATATSLAPLPNDAGAEVCNVGPGYGCEGRAGFQLLRDHVQIAPQSQKDNTTNHRMDPRILCGVYTHARSNGETNATDDHDDHHGGVLKALVETWGWRCDGWMAASTLTVERYGAVALPHDGPEMYGNMWQKTRSILTFWYTHYLSQYDYFYLAGDDTYVVVENLRRYLLELEAALGIGRTIATNSTREGMGRTMLQSNNEDASSTLPALYLGSQVRFRNETFVLGGSGYVLNRRALERLVVEAFPTCEGQAVTSAEDKLIGRCLHSIGVDPYNTADDSGAQRFLAMHPNWIATRDPLASYWTTTQYTPGRHYFQAMYQHWANLHGDAKPRHGKDVVSKHAIAFHHIKGPVAMRRMHAILYSPTEGTCLFGTVLYNGLQRNDAVVGPVNDFVRQLWRNIRSVLVQDPGIWGMLPCRE